MATQHETCNQKRIRLVNEYFELELADDARSAERLARGGADAGGGEDARGGVGARAVRLAEAEVVVRAHVDGEQAAPGVAEVPVVVARLALQQVELAAGRAAHRPVEAVAYAPVYVALVMWFEAAEQRHESLYAIITASSEPELQ